MGHVACLPHVVAGMKHVTEAEAEAAKALTRHTAAPCRLQMKPQTSGSEGQKKTKSEQSRAEKKSNHNVKNAKQGEKRLTQRRKKKLHKLFKHQAISGVVYGCKDVKGP
ncbi:hypothetical protein ACLKA6_008255 [Drosophila palustris]